MLLDKNTQQSDRLFKLTDVKVSTAMSWSTFCDQSMAFQSVSHLMDSK